MKNNISGMGWVTGVLLAISGMATAAELKDLYQAKVPQSANAQQWQRAAMSSVLIRLTGSEAVLASPAVAAQLAQSGNYVVQYQHVKDQGKALLQVTLDAQKLNQLLQSQQIPLWGPRRPDVLLWLAERINEQPAFVVNPTHPFRQALQQEAERFGLSLQFPLFDVDDTGLVTEAAAWSGDWQALAAASQRYKADQVQNLLLDQVPDSTGTLLYRLTYQVQQGSDIVSKELTNADVMLVAKQFCADLALQQSSQYAVNLNSQAVTSNQLDLVVEDVTSLSDVAALQKTLASMLTVKNVQLTEFQRGTAKLTLELSSAPTDFYRAISLVKQLQPLEPWVDASRVAPTTVPDSTVTSDSNLTTTDPAAAVARHSADGATSTDASAVPAATSSNAQDPLPQESGNNDVAPTAAQQQQLQDELQSELSGGADTADPAAASTTSATTSAAPIPATGTQIVETNHYRFSRS